MELDEIRQKKLEELQQQKMQEAVQEKIQLQQQIAQLETGAKMWMDSGAVSRYGNLRSAHPEKAVQVAVLIAQFVQSGKITRLITDEQLKELLVYMDEQKTETKVKIQRK
ncbi:MAG TPA: hypothetical protein HA362_00810 [Nanoarchaeota archaeon]|nr:hypothetical protein [Nanoarchaeota archaeon]